MSGRRCAPCGGWWSEDTECHGFEVLHGGGEKELIARAGKTSQPHALEAVVNLQVGKAHLDAFALVARLEECLCPHQPACYVAGIFMNIAGNLSRRAIGTALHLECTDFAVELGGAIAKRVAVVHGAGGVQHLTVRADINISPPVPAKGPRARGTGWGGGFWGQTSPPRKGQVQKGVGGGSRFGFRPKRRSVR